MRFFKRNPDPEQESPTDAYLGLRRKLLGLAPEQLGERFADASLLALLMEEQHSGAVATLVGVVDGASSLHFSSGGGFIGNGEHQPVAEANRRWLAAGANLLAQLPSVAEAPLPDVGVVQFVAVTADGLRAAVVATTSLERRQHPLSPLFVAGHDVITQIRLVNGG